MSTIGNKLTRARSRVGLSTREVAARLAEATGFKVSHFTVWQYDPADAVPSDDLVAVGDAFGVDPAWRVRGRRQGTDGAGGDLRSVREEWERFREGRHPRHALRRMVVGSWERSREDGQGGRGRWA